MIEANNPYRLFDSGDDSDLTVQSGNRTWRLHRLILRVGSEYFKKACNGDTFRARVVARTFFQSADLLKEGATGNIELHGDDPQMAGLMLR